MARKQQNIVFALTTPEEVDEWIEKSESILVGMTMSSVMYIATELETTPTVLDIHQNWCGPCSVMEPTYRRIWLENDEADKRVRFFTV